LDTGDDEAVLDMEDADAIFGQKGGYSILGGRTLPLKMVLQRESLRFEDIDQARVLEYLREKIGDEWLRAVQAIAEATLPDSDGRMRFVADKAFEFAQKDGLNIKATFCTPTGIENLPEAAHSAYREIHTLLSYMDGKRKDPLRQNKDRLLYQLKNHTIDVFSRVGYIALTTAFMSKVNFEPGASREFILGLMLRSPKLKKLGVTSIDLAEAAPVRPPERVIIGCRKIMPQWLVGKTVDSMRERYVVQTTIHKNTLYVGNGSADEVFRVIDTVENAQDQIEAGKAPGSNPALPIANEIHSQVSGAMSKEPATA